MKPVVNAATNADRRNGMPNHQSRNKSTAMDSGMKPMRLALRCTASDQHLLATSNVEPLVVARNDGQEKLAPEVLLKLTGKRQRRPLLTQIHRGTATPFCGAAGARRRDVFRGPLGL
jgi:hypothetical protein